MPVINYKEVFDYILIVLDNLDPFFGVALGAWLGYKFTRGQKIEETKREVYCAVKSNLLTHFAHREYEEVDRIFGKAALLANLELKSLLENYWYIVIAYKQSIEADILTKTSDSSQFQENRAEFQSRLKKNEQFQKAVETIEKLMRKELREKNIDLPNTSEAKECFDKIIKEIKSSRIILKSIYLTKS